MRTQDTSREDIGRTNRRLVLDEIVRNGPLPRSEISSTIGLTNASISRITRDFIEAGLIVETDDYQSPARPGRRFIGLKVNPEFGCVLGIGINAFQQSITLADLGNEVLQRREFSLDGLENSEDALKKISDAAEDVIKASRIPRHRILGCSVAVTGSINPADGLVRSADPLGWSDVDIRSALESRLGLGVQVENLPNAMNLAETQFGCAKGRRNVVLLSASLALGLSLFLDGQVFRGHNFSIGLLKNLKLPGLTSPNGEVRSVDDLAGGWAILKASGQAEDGNGASNLLRLMDRAQAGDTETCETFRTAGAELHQIIETIAAIVPPELIIVAGPLARVPAYVDGLKSQQKGSDNLPPIVVSDITSQRAARLLAIRDFLTKRELDFGAANRKAA